MMKRTCVIVDDSINCIKDLTHDIENLDLITIERTFTNPDLFLAKLDTIESEIIFLDIEMPISGIEVAEKIKNRTVVFVSGTSNIQNALDAFQKVKTKHFLQKPVRISELNETINDILSNNNEYMIVNSEKYSKHKLNFEDIAYIETIPNNNNYKTVHFVSDLKAKLVIKERESLSSWCSKHQLPKNFLKLGASIVVNMDTIIALNGRSGSQTPDLVIQFNDGSTSDKFSISTKEELHELLNHKPEFNGSL